MYLDSKHLLFPLGMAILACCLFWMLAAIDGGWRDRSWSELLTDMAVFAVIGAALGLLPLLSRS